MHVSLYDHSGTALVIPHPTGITYSNQAGGHACLQPEIEGFLVPIANDVGLSPQNEFRSPENELFAYFGKLNSCGAPISDTDADRIESILHKSPVWGGLSVDRKRLNDSVESWVHVTVSDESNLPVLVTGLKYPLSAILTWNNTD